MRAFMRKMKTFILVLSVLAAACTACSPGGNTPGNNASGNDSSVNDMSGNDAIAPLKTTFIKCGKADIIVLECGDETMVIDTGEDDDGDKITEYLADQGIEKVDDLIITHYDKDHVGGAAFLLDSIPVTRVYVPDYEGTSDEYFAFLDALKKLEEDGFSSSDSLFRLTESVSFTLGNASVEIYPPSSYEVPDDGREYDNDLSLVTIVKHGDNTLLFMGDAEDARMEDFMAKEMTDRCDLIKIPHHGRYHSALKELVASLQPKYAVITDSEKNPAEEKTLDLLEKNEVQVFSTSQGDVTAVSDGVTISVDG